MSAKRGRIVTTLVAVAAIAGAAGYAYRENQRNRQVLAYMELAHHAMHMGDLTTCERAFKQALEVEPKCLAARTGLADVYDAQGRLERALAEHRRGVEVAPRSPDAHTALAQALVECHRYAGAIECLKRGLEVAPRDTYMRLLLAFSYRRNGDFRRARAQLAEIEKMEPGSVAVRNGMRAMAREAKKKPAHAAPRKPSQPQHRDAG